MGPVLGLLYSRAGAGAAAKFSTGATKMVQIRNNDYFNNMKSTHLNE
jgi:hypothetical protein